MSTGSASPQPASSARPSHSDDRVVRTARLTLAPYRLDDFADFTALRADPEVVRGLGGQPLGDEEVWARFHRLAGHWALLGYGYWAVRETASGRYLGEVGAGDYRRTLDPPLGDDPELGWAFMSHAWGQGFATEAVTAALDWLDTRSGPGRRTCFIDDANAASIRLATRCGFREFARSRYKDKPVILFERLVDA